MRSLSNRLVSIIMVIATFVAVGLGAYQMATKPDISKKEFVQEAAPDFSKSGIISELAAMQVYFHDFGDFTEGENNFLRFGYKKMWIEYGGTVKVGVDAKKVQVSQPDEEGVVKVTIPPAIILSTNIDRDSIGEVSEAGWFAGFSTTEKKEVFARAKSDLDEKVGADETILRQGRERAKKLLERYIKNVGNALGKTYTVQWVEIE